jgi:nitroreductase
MDFLELAKRRYSVRKFSDKPVEDEKLEKILEAANLAPSAHRRYPFRVWVFKSPEAREKVAQTTRFTFDAPIIFCLAADTERGATREPDGRNFADVDASIVGTHMMLETADLGLGSTWVGSFDAPKLKELFPELAPYDLVALFPTGYPAEDCEPSPSHFKRNGTDHFTTVL